MQSGLQMPYSGGQRRSGPAPAQGSSRAGWTPTCAPAPVPTLLTHSPWFLSPPRRWSVFVGELRLCTAVTDDAPSWWVARGGYLVPVVSWARPCRPSAHGCGSCRREADVHGHGRTAWSVKVRGSSAYRAAGVGGGRPGASGVQERRAPSWRREETGGASKGPEQQARRVGG